MLSYALRRDLGTAAFDSACKCPSEDGGVGEVRWLALRRIPDALVLRGRVLCANVLPAVGNLLIPLCASSPSLEPGPE